MSYTLTNGPLVVRDADGAYIPADNDNADWQVYQQWLADGNTPNPAPTVAPPIDTAGLLAQARASLTSNDLAGAVGRILLAFGA